MIDKIVNFFANVWSAISGFFVSAYERVVDFSKNVFNFLVSYSGSEINAYIQLGIIAVLVLALLICLFKAIFGCSSCKQRKLKKFVKGKVTPALIEEQIEIIKAQIKAKKKEMDTCVDVAQAEIVRLRQVNGVVLAHEERLLSYDRKRLARLEERLSILEDILDQQKKGVKLGVGINCDTTQKLIDELSVQRNGYKDSVARRQRKIDTVKSELEKNVQYTIDNCLQSRKTLADEIIRLEDEKRNLEKQLALVFDPDAENPERNDGVYAPIIEEPKTATTLTPIDIANIERDKAKAEWEQAVKDREELQKELALTLENTKKAQREKEKADKAKSKPTYTSRRVKKSKRKGEVPEDVKIRIVGDPTATTATTATDGKKSSKTKKTSDTKTTDTKATAPSMKDHLVREKKLRIRKLRKIVKAYKATELKPDSEYEEPIVDIVDETKLTEEEITYIDASRIEDKVDDTATTVEEVKVDGAKDSVTVVDTLDDEDVTEEEIKDTADDSEEEVVVDDSAEEELVVTEDTTEEEVVVVEDTTEEEIIVVEDTTEEELVVTEDTTEEEIVVVEDTTEEDVVVVEDTTEEDIVVVEDTTEEDVVVVEDTTEEDIVVVEDTTEEDVVVVEDTTEEDVVVVEDTTEEDIVVVEDTTEEDVVVVEDTTEEDVVVVEDTTEEEIVVAEDTTEEEIVVVEDTTEEEIVVVEDTTEEEVVVVEDTTEEKVVVVEDTTEEEIVVVEDTTEEEIVVVEDTTEEEIVVVEDTTEEDVKPVISPETERKISAFEEKYAGIPATPINRKNKFQKPVTKLVAKDPSKKRLTVDTEPAKKAETPTKIGYSGKWLIVEENGKYFAKLVASNGGVMLVTSKYQSVNGLKTCIANIKQNLAENNYLISANRAGKFVFKVLSASKRVIIESDAYDKKHQCEKAVESAKRFSETAVIVE